MLRIAICDDDMPVCGQIETILQEYDKMACIGIEAEIFNDGQELLTHIQTCASFDLIFLDIELITFSGVEVGQTIRNDFDDHVSKIVFISSQTGYESALFDIQPLNFLKKPLDKNKLIKCVELALKILAKEKKTFEYQSKYEKRKIYFQDILYFESGNKRIKIVVTKGEDYFYETLDGISEVLPEIFVRIHASFIVNLHNVKRISNKELVMNNNDKLPVSRVKLKHIRDLLINTEKEKSDARL